MYQVSPGVVVNEIDLTTIIPTVSTTEGALAGVYHWGPLDQRVLVDSETSQLRRFGRPSNFNAETWFTGANFLRYGNALYIVRAGDTTGNTVEKTHTGNSTNLAAQADQNSLQLSSNTSNLLTGMVLFYSNNAALPSALTTSNPPKIAAITNSTYVTLDQSATANIDSIDVLFREDIVYTSVAQETVDYTIDWDGQIVKNDDDYHNVDGLFDDSVLYVARYPGKNGDSLRISVCDTAGQFHSNTVLGANASLNAASNATNMTATVGSNTLVFSFTPANTANATHVNNATTIATDVKDTLAVSDLVEVGNSRIGFQYLKVTAIGNVSTNATTNVVSFSVSVDDEVKLGANVTHTNLNRYWEFYNLVDRAPGVSDYVLQFGNSAAVDEVHVVVVDEDGAFTGSPGAVLEVHKSMSRATDAKAIDGGTNYYKDVINQRSQYIWFANDRTTARSNTASFIASSTATAPLNISFYGGADGPDESNVPLSTLTFAYDKYTSPEDVDISLVMQGKARGEGVSYYTQLANYLIDNICETRKDCVAFISPDKRFVVDNVGDEVADMLAARAVMRSSSYGVLDTGYKYQYDPYNDVYRWIPLNGDIAGLCARTDQTNDAWWSPAGYKRGQIKNVVRLAFNPRKADRDQLYKVNINPVITQNAQGTFLFGDKTMLSMPSSFDRINVRRLFIVLEKAISTAAKYMLFEFNDDFTRAQFKSMVVPFLKDVQGRRGITDFFVKCDSENNPGQVRMRNEFVGDIYIKPNHSINFITLNFIAVRDDVAFAEVLGKF